MLGIKIYPLDLNSDLKMAWWPLHHLWSWEMATWWCLDLDWRLVSSHSLYYSQQDRWLAWSCARSCQLTWATCFVLICSVLFWLSVLCLCNVITQISLFFFFNHLSSTTHPLLLRTNPSSAKHLHVLLESIHSGESLGLGTLVMWTIAQECAIFIMSHSDSLSIVSGKTDCLNTLSFVCVMHVLVVKAKSTDSTGMRHWGRREGGGWMGRIKVKRQKKKRQQVSYRVDVIIS